MSDISTPKVDDKHWPIVVITMPSQRLTDEQFAAFLTRLGDCWHRGQLFCLVVDVRSAPALPAPQRRMLAESLDANADKHPDKLRAVAVVLSNGVQRGIIAVLTWLMRKPFEMRPFTDIESALTWSARSLVVPARASKRPNHNDGRHQQRPGT